MCVFSIEILSSLVYLCARGGVVGVVLCFAVSRFTSLHHRASEIDLEYESDGSSRRSFRHARATLCFRPDDPAIHPGDRSYAVSYALSSALLMSRNIITIARPLSPPSLPCTIFWNPCGSSENLTFWILNTEDVVPKPRTKFSERERDFPTAADARGIPDLS